MSTSRYVVEIGTPGKLIELQHADLGEAFELAQQHVAAGCAVVVRELGGRTLLAHGDPWSVYGRGLQRVLGGRADAPHIGVATLR